MTFVDVDGDGDVDGDVTATLTATTTWTWTTRVDVRSRSLVGNFSRESGWSKASGPARSLMLAVVSWVAEQERRRISERTKAALDRLPAKGVHVGRPRARVDVAEALRLRAEGQSIRTIARRRRIESSTLHRVLAAHADVPKAGCLGVDPQDGEITSAA